MSLLLPAVLAILLHEVAHARVALLCGDETAHRAKRTSLNPLHHLCPVGTILVPLALYYSIGFAAGWAKPVPVNYDDLGQLGLPVAIAGPAANFVMALLWAPLALWAPLEELARFGVLVNILIAVVNLLPIKPLDGWRVMQLMKT